MEADYILVHGYGGKGDREAIGIARLELVVKLAKRNRKSRIILSGGRKGPGPTEAKNARRYLAERGIPPSRMIMEGRSGNTLENAFYSKRIIDKGGIRKPVVIVVTSDFHMPRTRFIDTAIFGAGYRLRFIASPTPARFLKKARRYERIALKRTKEVKRYLTHATSRSIREAISKIRDAQAKNNDKKYFWY